MSLFNRIFKRSDDIKPENSYSQVLGLLSRPTDIYEFMDIVPNPDEILQKQGLGINGYYPLLNDPHISSCVQSRKSGLLSLEWDIDREEEKTDKTEFIWAILNNLDIVNIIRDALDAFLYGFKPMEILYIENSIIEAENRTFEGNFLVPINIVGLPPHWFSFDRLGNIRLADTVSLEKKLINRNKLLNVSHGATTSNPYGHGVLSQCFWPATFKKGVQKFWVRYLEQYGSPFIKATAPLEDEKGLEEIGESLYRLIQTGQVVFGQDVNTEVLNAGNSATTTSYKEFVHFSNSEISKAILSQTLTTEQGDTGSYSMSQTHLQVRKDVIDSDARMIENMMNNFFKIIISLNFSDDSVVPKFKFHEKRDVNKDFERGLQLIQTGKWNITKKFLTKCGFDEDEIEFNKPDIPEENIGFAENSDSSNLDDFTDELMQDFVPATEEMLEPVIDMIKDGKSYDQIAAKLIDMYDDLNDTKIEEIFDAAFSIAQAEGFISGQE